MKHALLTTAILSCSGPGAAEAIASSLWWGTVGFGVFVLLALVSWVIWSFTRHRAWLLNLLTLYGLAAFGLALTVGVASGDCGFTYRGLGLSAAVIATLVLGLQIVSARRRRRELKSVGS